MGQLVAVGIALGLAVLAVAAVALLGIAGAKWVGLRVLWVLGG